MVEVALDLWLTGEELRPFPFLEQLLVMEEGIGVALGVEPRAGIAVPKPGPAQPIARLQHPDREAILASPPQLVQPENPSAHDEYVNDVVLRH